MTRKRLSEKGSFQIKSEIGVRSFLGAEKPVGTVAKRLEILVKPETDVPALSEAGECVG